MVIILVVSSALNTPWCRRGFYRALDSLGAWCPLSNCSLLVCSAKSLAQFAQELAVSVNYRYEFSISELDRTKVAMLSRDAQRWLAHIADAGT